jgi:sugar lactone lactonase YvrE
MRSFLSLLTLALTFSLSSLPAVAQPRLRVVRELSQPPGNLTVTPAGEAVFSLHQFYNPPYPLATFADGEIVPFPMGANNPIAEAVLGIRSDSRGVVWLLDNATPPQLIGWDTNANELYQSISLADVTPSDSFINDLRIAESTETVYITDPAGGENAGLIVVDLATGETRRVLEGHESVVPEDLDLFVEGNPLRQRTSEGTYVRPRVGVDAIALDSNQEWLYYGALHGTRLYRIRTEDLRNRALTPEELAQRVEFYANRPITDGILIDSADNIYLGDLQANAIGVITPDREYQRLIEDPRLSWVDDFEFSADGQTIYAVVNRLHLSAPLNAGVEAGSPPFYIFGFRPLAPENTP